MQTKVFSWFREMMDYYEVGSWKKLPGERKLLGSWESCTCPQWMRKRENQGSSSGKQQEQKEKG